MNILTAFLSRAATCGERPAIITATGTSISFAAIAETSGAVAAEWARRGIGGGDRVLVAVPLGIDLYIGLAALWRLGAVAVFPEPALGLQGLRHAARTTAPRACLTGGWYRLLPWIVPALWRIALTLRVDRNAAPAPARAPLAEVASTAPALISFTSGSTGSPKAIVRSHGFLAAQNACVAALLAADQPQTDLVAFPVFVIANLALGNTSVLPGWPLRRPDAAPAAGIIAQLRSQSITRALLPPAICETLAAAPGPLPLQAIFTGGGPVFPDMMQRLLAATPHLRLVAVYGSTEAEPIAHCEARDITPADWQAMAGGGGLLAGKPIDAIRLRIVDDEIVVTGAHVNKGYLDPGRDAATKQTIAGEVWHRTGDAGRLDEAGRLWLLGRCDGRVAGLFPFAVETAARSWPGVRRAALCSHDGRAVLAIEGAPAALAQWQARAAAMAITEVRLIDPMPLDARHRSKIDYPALRALLARR